MYVNPVQVPLVRPDADLAVFDRVIIEIRCGIDSRIGESTKHSQGCRVERITIVDDFTTEQGTGKVLKLLAQYRLYPILLWVSIPCTAELHGLI